MTTRAMFFNKGLPPVLCGDSLCCWAFGRGGGSGGASGSTVMTLSVVVFVLLPVCSPPLIMEPSTDEFVRLRMSTSPPCVPEPGPASISPSDLFRTCVRCCGVGGGGGRPGGGLPGSRCIGRDVERVGGRGGGPGLDTSPCDLTEDFEPPAAPAPAAADGLKVLSTGGDVLWSDSRFDVGNNGDTIPPPPPPPTVPPPPPPPPVVGVGVGVGSFGLRAGGGGGPCVRSGSGGGG